MNTPVDRISLKAMEDLTHTENQVRHGTIYVVVPVFNRKSLTRRFLSCLSKQSFRHFETIVVDDGSTDGTAELVSEEFRDVQLLRGDGNLWWTGAINEGIRHAMTRATPEDAILVINDDLEISSSYLETLHGLWKSMPQTLIGSVAVGIEDPEIIVDGGTTVNWWTAKIKKLNSGRKLSEFEEGHHEDVSLLTGRGTLIPIQVFLDIGLYNDRHYQQSGDDELPVRARNAGYSLIVSYTSVVETHAKASCSVNVSDTYSLRDFRQYFFGIRSNARLKGRFLFAYDTATNPFSFIGFLLCDLARVASHFLLRLRFR